MTINEQIESGVSEIVLTADTAEQITIPKWANVVLDLAGFTLSGDGATHTIINNGILRIKDTSSAKTGTIHCDVKSCANIFNNFGGNLMVDRAILTRGGNSWYCIHNWGSLVVINYVQIDIGGNAAAIHNGFYSPKAENPDGVFCNMVINDALITTTGSPNACVKNDEYGIMSITGGRYVSATQYAVNTWNDLTITGGTFISNAATPLVCGSTPSAGGHCDLKVRGGTFKGATGIVTDCSEGKSDPEYVAPVWAVAGGQFSPAIETTYLAEGVDLVLLPDGTYGVELMSANGWKVERGTNAAGFIGLSGAVFKNASLEYTAGGIELPVAGFVPTAVIGVSAVGGLEAYYDAANKKIVLYKNGAEASGTITDVTLVVIGQ